MYPKNDIYAANESYLKCFNDRPNEIYLGFLNQGIEIVDDKSIIFKYPSNLTEINLSNNKILNFVGLLGAFSHLKIINMRHNRLKIINDNHFINNTKLIYVYLEFNQISSITYNAFRYHIYLFELKLDYNQILKLEKKLIRFNFRLQILTMSFNKIKKIPVTLFNNNQYVYKVDFSYNKIKTIEEKTFNVTKELNYLNLMYNDLSEIDISWQYLVFLEYINLSNNKLQTLDKQMFQIKKLKYIAIDRNTIKCSCNFTFLKNYLKKIVNKDYIQCSKSGREIHLITFLESLDCNKGNN